MSVCRVVFDSTRCSAIGLCEAAVPDVFQLGGDGVLHVVMTEVPIDRRTELEEAALNCPTQSIRVEIVD